jgi:hypothetical protein
MYHIRLIEKKLRNAKFSTLEYYLPDINRYLHQPFNVPTAGAWALMDYT